MLFAGIMGFIYSDLVVPPLSASFRKAACRLNAKASVALPRALIVEFTLVVLPQEALDETAHLAGGRGIQFLARVDEPVA